MLSVVKRRINITANRLYIWVSPVANYNIIYANTHGH